MPVFVGAGTSSFMKGSDGVGVSNLTTTQRNALRDAHNQGSSILNGAMIYNTTDNEFQVRKGGAWVNLSTS